MRIKGRFLAALLAISVILSISLKIFLGPVYRLPILMYHSIDHISNGADRMTVSPDQFDKQMRYLNQMRYNVIPLEKAVWYIEGRIKPPPKTVAVTLDDGYHNNYEHAFPILKKYRIPATIFVITGKLGSKGFMDWKEVEEISRSNIVEIGSHTVSHPFLTELDDASLRKELVESKKVLEKMTGREIKFLCYPMGDYDEHVKSAAKEAGYKAAFATKPTRLSPNYDIYEIKRVRISPAVKNMFIFWIKLSGYHAFFRLVQDDYRNMPTLLREPKNY